MRGVRERARCRRESSSFVSFIHPLTARASFPTRSQDARIDARGGLGATASAARRRGGAATTGSGKSRGRGRPRGSTTVAAAMRRDAGDDDDRARVDRREVRSKAMRHRSRGRFDRYRLIDRSVTGFRWASRPCMNGRCVPRGGESPFMWAIEVWARARAGRTPDRTTTTRVRRH